MIQWTLGEVPLSPRITLKIEISGGGTLTPEEVLSMARLLEWIGRACRQWQNRVPRLKV